MAQHRRALRSARLGVLLALLGLTFLVPSSSLGIVQIADVQGEGLQASDVDSRTATLAPTEAQTAAVERLGAEVRWNEFGTPQSLIRYGGFLATNLRADNAAGAARAWVEANRSLFRLGSLAGLELQNDVRLPRSNGHAVVFRQTVGGLPTATDGVLVVGVVGTPKRGWDVAYVSSRVTGDTTLAGTAELSPVEAWVESAQKVGESVSTGEVSVSGREKGWTLLDVEGFDQPQSVRAAAFPTPTSGPLRAYETTVLDTPESGQIEGYWQVVDADTGAVLFRESIVDHAADNPAWRIFPAYPEVTTLNAFPWSYPSDDTRELWCWDNAPGCDRAVANPAARVPWDTDARTETPTFTTVGNAADSFELWFIPDDDEGEPGTGYQPTSATRDYVYPWTNVWFETGCDPANFVVGSGNDIDAAVTNLFAMHNRMHDWSYFLGFTEELWNAQDYNFGSPTLENDRLLGRAQSGAVVPGSRDNANMATRPDGMSSITNMFLWQPIAGGFYAPCVDGDYDMAVIGHEFAHMVENRMIGKGNRRMGEHAGAMGESVSDLMAMEYLNEYSFVTGGVQRFAVGAYATGNTVEAIRNYNMSWQPAGRFPQEARDHDTNPLNFSDVGYDIVGPQVHADGEIWSATNFDLRSLLNQRYGSGNPNIQRQCADGELAATSCPGNRRWIQLMFDSFLLQPTTPTFLDARDAILASDVMRFGGANQDLLWLGFARRGFGFAASVTGTQDVLPVPSWESPLHDEATLTFEAFAKDEGGAAITDFDVYVGDYEARSVAIDTTEPFVPGPQRGYNFVAVAPGYGHVRFAVRNLSPGENRTISIHF